MLNRNKENPMSIGLIDIMSALVFLFILFSFFFIVVLHGVDIKYQNIKSLYQEEINDKKLNYISKKKLIKKYTLNSDYERIELLHQKEIDDKKINYISKKNLEKKYMLKSDYKILKKTFDHKYKELFHYRTLYLLHKSLF